jgi:hypothetical protein
MVFKLGHCGCRAKAADMIVMVMGYSDILHWLVWKLLLNRTKQHLGLGFRVRGIHQRQPLRKFNDQTIVRVTSRLVNAIADCDNLQR